MMDEDEMLSGSFFEPVNFQPHSNVPETPDVRESLSTFMTDSLNIGGNPWDPPSTGSIDIANILSGVPLPEIYSTAFALATPVVERVSVSALNKILSVSGLPHATIEKILNLAAPANSNSTRVNRGEFNVALALVGLAQKNMDVSLETLIERKHDLPEPILTNLGGINFNRNLSFSAVSRPPPLQADDPWAVPSTNGEHTGSPFTDEPISRFPSLTGAIAPSITGILPREEEFQWFLNTDVITVKFAPEREGFLFKHVNYIVESQRLETRVIRRYSDFWWLMECLVKKYPYRILPALPPKKIGVNGFYFTVDESFLEKRRKGLTRFLNFIARHPVLKDDELVEIFLKESTEIAVWRRNNTPDLEEEYMKKEITPEIERCIPDDLDERLNKVLQKLEDGIKHYRNMCNLMERIARCQEGTSADYMRYSLSLNSLIEKEKDCCYLENCDNCAQVINGLEQVSSHFQKTSAIMEDMSTATIETVLENLKRHRDLLVSFRETFERRDRLAVDSTETLSGRIAANQAKLTPLKGKEESDPEVERLSTAIKKDQEDIQHQLQRKNFARYCLHAELSLFHKSTAFVSLLYQSFVNEQIKYSQQLYENWKLLSPKVYDMPVETSGFG